MVQVFAGILKILTGFRKDRSGGLLIYTALALPALLGAAGLSTDVVLWYLQKRAIQTATDSAAISGAYELARTGGATAIAQVIENGAAVNGYDNSAGDALTYHAPPLSGAFAGDGDAVEVFIERPVRTFFTSLFLSGSVAVEARAVAAIDLLDTCVWVLDPNASSALKVAGGAQIELGCGIMVNST
ncbi:MAG: pilus assembly protein TadG-related protein, partial [Limibaculum sp.]